MIVLLFVIAIGCSKDEAKPDCDVLEANIVLLEKQMDDNTIKFADNDITEAQYVAELNRIIDAINEYTNQLEDCE